MGDGIRECAASSDDAAFACTFDTERVVRRRIVFRDDAAQVGKVGRSRQQIVGERAGQELTLVVILQMLEAGTPEALYHRANHLTTERERVHGTTYILHDDIVDDLDLAELGIDR